MNPLKLIIFVPLLACLITPQAQSAESVAAGGTTPKPETPVSNQPTAVSIAEAKTAPAAEDAASATNSPPVALKNNPPAIPTLGPGELRLNFRNAPLETVLSYLSDAAGFIINMRTDVKGKVSVWSNQPVSKEEALDLLNSALDQNGYAAVRVGRTLTIYPKEDAKKQNLPVKTSNRPEDIPKNDEMVTQIVPVRFISAVQVARDLQPLIPDKATLTANEAGNSLIITDAQANIRRLVEIVRALDTALSSVSTVKVFPLQYADAKALASVIKDLFAPQETSRTTGQGQGGQGRVFNQFQGGFGGFPGAGGGRGGGGGAGAPGAGGNSSSGARAPTPRVVAVAEERSNSVVVSAPDEQMPIIEDLVRQVDTSVEDVTVLRVFRLKFADAQETADLLSSLFSESNTSSGQGFRGQIQFGGGRFGSGFGGARSSVAAAGTGDQSTRARQMSRVVAVADMRTSSVVVSAARDLMVQIEKMIMDLDADASKKQQVFVFDVQNTDPQQVQEILQSLFPQPQNSGSYNSRSTSRQQNAAGNQLNSRATQRQNQGFGSGSGFGGSGSGFGGSGMGGFGR